VTASIHQWKRSGVQSIERSRHVLLRSILGARVLTTLLFGLACPGTKRKEYTVQHKAVWLMVVLALVAGVFAQEADEEERIEVEKTLALGKAKRVEVEVSLGVGELSIEGTEDLLVFAEFECSDERLVPDLEYEEEEDEGLLVIEQPEVGDDIEKESEWLLELHESVVKELSIELGVGDAELAFGGMALEYIGCEVGIGELEVDFAGCEQDLDEAEFEVGVGEVTIVVPCDVGVKVEAEAGIGEVSAEGLTQMTIKDEKDEDADDEDDEDEDADAEEDATETVWVNGMWGKSDVTLRISAEVGIGDIRIELAADEE